MRTSDWKRERIERAQPEKTNAENNLAHKDYSFPRILGLSLGLLSMLAFGDSTNPYFPARSGIKTVSMYWYFGNPGGENSTLVNKVEPYGPSTDFVYINDINAKGEATCMYCYFVMRDTVTLAKQVDNYSGRSEPKTVCLVVPDKGKTNTWQNVEKNLYGKDMNVAYKSTIIQGVYTNRLGVAFRDVLCVTRIQEGYNQVDLHYYAPGLGKVGGQTIQTNTKAIIMESALKSAVDSTGASLLPNK